MFDTSHNKHDCFADGCNRSIDKKYLMCPEHWAMVPSDIQKWVYLSHTDERTNSDYIEAIRAAKLAVKSKTSAVKATDTALILGDTYPVREKLKALGGVWSPNEKGWRVPKAQKLVAEVLVGNADQVETLPGMEEPDV